MKFNEKYNIDDDILSLFEFDSEKEELKHDAFMIMFKFLSEIERVSENTLYKKDLAMALDTSKSFISQLFSGNKLANLLTIAKLQKSYNITFHVKAVPNQSFLSIDKPIINVAKYEYPKGETRQYGNSALTVVAGSIDYVLKSAS